jgi:hypothetical protein
MQLPKYPLLPPSLKQTRGKRLLDAVQEGDLKELLPLV